MLFLTLRLMAKALPIGYGQEYRPRDVTTSERKELVHVGMLLDQSACYDVRTLQGVASQCAHR